MASKNQDVDPTTSPEAKWGPGLWTEQKPGNQSETPEGLDLLVSPPPGSQARSVPVVLNSGCHSDPLGRSEKY